MESRNVAQLLKNSLKPDQLRLLDLVRQEATERGLPLYIVGGAVRDLLLGRRLNDFDLTMEGDALGLARALKSKHGGKVTPHIKFGTAKWFLPEGLDADHDGLDLISARSETYHHPAALPTIGHGSIGEDLRRRDFTINALAVRLDGAHYGEMRDDFHGEADLKQGAVRVLHPGSFIDDPTRMYRAVRYAGRYGFHIAGESLALMPAARAYVEQLSPQRVRHELDLILDEPNAARMLKQLDALELLAAVHPALANFERSALSSLHLEDPALENRNSRWVLWLMHLSPKEIAGLNDRLHFPADLLKMLDSASRFHAKGAALVGLKPSQAVEQLEGYALPTLEVLSMALGKGEIKGMLNSYLSVWRHVKPKTTGHDLKRLGIAPGPRYREILRRLRAAWLDGEVQGEEAETRLLNEIVRESEK